MKYECIIAEDSDVERDLLEDILRSSDAVEIAGVFENGLQAFKFLQQHPVDIAFTDVDMPQLSGFALLKSLQQQPVFIFISSHGKYAADSYDFEAVDFMKKPVTQERIFRAVDKAVDSLSKKHASFSIEVDPVIIVQTSEGITKLRPSAIAYAESKANYSLLCLRDGTTLMILVNLKNLEEQLPQGSFIRIHKNYLVNWELTGLIRKESLTVAGKYELPIGNSYRQEVIDKIALHQILERKVNKGK